MRQIIFLLVLLLGVNPCVLADESRTISAPDASASQSDRKSLGGQANASANADKPTYVITTCSVVSNRDVKPSDISHGLNPNQAASRALSLKGASSTSIFQQPKHGILHKLTEADRGKYFDHGVTLDPNGGDYLYIPKDGYRGKDNASFWVNFGNEKIEVTYVLHVTNNNYVTDYDWNRFCGQPDLIVPRPPAQSSSPLVTENYDAYIVAKDVEGRREHPTRKLKVVTRKFFAGNVVLAVKPEGDKVLVSTDPNDLTDAAWVPRSDLIDEKDFHPVKKWEGPRSAHWSTEDYDAGVEYTISADGTFSAYYDDNRSPRSWTGRTFRSGNIIWFRAGSDGFDDMSMFVLNASGQLWATGSEE